MPQNSRRRQICTAHRRKVAVHQRLRDTPALLAISYGLVLVRDLMGKFEEATGHDCGGRTGAVAVMHAVIVEVVPRDTVVRQLADDVVCNFFCSRKEFGVVRSGGSLGESIKRPCRAAGPRGAGTESLMCVSEQQFARSAVIGQIKIYVVRTPAA